MIVPAYIESPSLTHSPIHLAAVEDGYSLCGVQTHLLLSHFQFMLKGVHTTNVEPQVILKYRQITHCKNVATQS